MWVVVGSRLSAVDPPDHTTKCRIGGKNKKPPPHINFKKKIAKERLETVTSLDYFERKLDDKRRLTIPAELRDEFVGGVVVTRGFQDYLHMYPRLVWDNDVEPALSGSILDERVADLNVQFREGKQSAELDDKQGRITIEQHLLDFAGIDKGVVAVRAGKYWRLKRA